MKFLAYLQKIIKNGFYVDYFFKNIIFMWYRKLISINFLYLVERYLAEKFFFMLKKCFQFIFYLNNFIKKLTFFETIQILIFVVLQLILLVLIFL